MRSLFEKKKQSTVQIYTLKTSQATKKIGKPCFSDMPKISERIFLIQMTKW